MKPMRDPQSSHLHPSLQLLAQKGSTPGFADKLQTECLLTSIALDLRRDFIDVPINAAVPSSDNENSALSIQNAARYHERRLSAQLGGPSSYRCKRCPVDEKRRLA